MATAIESLQIALRHQQFESNVLGSARRAVAVTDGMAIRFAATAWQATEM